MIKIPRRRYIRPGQNHFYRKGTQAQIDERIGYVSRLLRAGKTKTEIHRAVRDKFKIQWRQCNRYIAFVTRTTDTTDTGTDTRLARAGCCQSTIAKMHAELKMLCGGNLK